MLSLIVFEKTVLPEYVHYYIQDQMKEIENLRVFLQVEKEIQIKN